jgi:glycerol-3-phosphate acyltransferase PlsY
MPVVLVLFGYFAGAIPFGVIVARRLGHIDIQDHGSGNIGATNVARTLGTLPGALVLLLDAAKGALPVYLAIRYHGELWTVIATGAAAIAGHCFSPFLEFKGGKGVATTLGVFVVLAPPQVAIAVIVFAVVVRLTRVPAIGSLCAVATIAGMLFSARDYALGGFALATFALLVYTHRTNLAKLATSLPRSR